MALSSIIAIPIYAVIILARTTGSFKEVRCSLAGGVLLELAHVSLSSSDGKK